MLEQNTTTDWAKLERLEIEEERRLKYYDALDRFVEDTEDDIPYGSVYSTAPDNAARLTREVLAVKLKDPTFKVEDVEDIFNTFLEERAQEIMYETADHCPEAFGPYDRRP